VRSNPPYSRASTSSRFLLWPMERSKTTDHDGEGTSWTWKAD
jgi:hypothetical protein